MENKTQLKIKIKYFELSDKRSSISSGLNSHTVSIGECLDHRVFESEV